MQNNDLAEMLRQVQRTLAQAQPAFEQARAAFREFTKNAPNWLERINAAGDAFRENWGALTRALAELAELDRLMEPTGWLPHYTTPVEIVTRTELGVAERHRLITDYYRESWTDVEQKFLENIDGYDISEEAKAVFKEALTAHGHGLHQAVVRLIFPEIESEVRRSFFNNSTSRALTSQKDLLDTAGRLPFGYVIKRSSDYRLYVKLSQHMYMHVSDENRSAVADDPVPNRHAALHGIVAYSTVQNSINALIMADFAFQLIATIKGLQARDEARSEAERSSK